MALKALCGILPCLFLFGRDEDIWSEGFCANTTRRGKLHRSEAEFVAFEGGGEGGQGGAARGDGLEEVFHKSPVSAGVEGKASEVGVILAEYAAQEQEED